MKPYYRIFIVVTFPLYAKAGAVSDDTLYFYAFLALTFLLLGLSLYWIKENRETLKERINSLRSKRKRKTRKKSTKSHEVLEDYRIATQQIPLDNQPFRLSGMLHILTNKVTDMLKSQHHHIYYDIDREVTRYIVGDNDYIEQVLELLVNEAGKLNTESEIIVKITKYKESALVFDIANPKSATNKEKYSNQKHEEYEKAQQIAAAMQGTIEIKSGKLSGTHFIFTIPYVKDPKSRSNQSKLRSILAGKKALFIGKTKDEMKRAEYIFETYGIKFDDILAQTFEKRKPELKKYDMAILRSSNLTPTQIEFLKKVRLRKENELKIIIIHDLFISEKLINRTKVIADAEIYAPMIIGDVEEILYQIFIKKSKAVKGINNLEIFDPKTFTLQGSSTYTEEILEKYKGARIAIAEDSKIDQKVIRNILSSDNIKLFCLNNGQEVIELLKKETIDILFTDINMPVLDGISLAKKIRSEPKWQHIPIISTSSMVFPHEIKAMQAAGISAAVSKPIVAQDIYEALEKFLEVHPDRKREMHIKKQIQVDYSQFDSNILDVRAGVEHAGNPMQYRELLQETLDVIQHTPEKLRILIKEEKFEEIKSFSASMKRIYDNIYARDMVHMFTELSYGVKTNSNLFLHEYILLYLKKFNQLENEIKKYLRATKQ